MSRSASPEQSGSEDDDFGSDGERVTKRPRPASPSSSTSDSDDDDHQQDSSSAQDVTAIARKRREKITQDAKTAFGCSPAKPPAAYVNHRLEQGRPCSLPTSMATSRTWKMNALQRHVDSFSFFSRDRLEGPWDLPESIAGFVSIEHALRVDTFEQTGTLLWVQAQCLEDAAMSPADDDSLDFIDCTFAHTYIDGAGRQLGQERLLSSGLRPDDNDLAVPDEETGPHKTQNFLQHSHLGISPYRPDMTPYGLDCDVILYDFTTSQTAFKDARGLYHDQFTNRALDDRRCQQMGAWLAYDQPNFQTTLTVQVWPSKEGDSLGMMMSCMPDDWIVKGQEELNLRISITREDDESWSLSQIRTSPHDLGFETIPKPEGHRFAVIATNEGSGYCWFGHHDGTIEFLDIMPWIRRNFLSCPADEDETLDHPPLCACGASKIEPLQVLPPSSNGAVTNLVAVGRGEVVAAFSDGSLLLLQAGRENRMSFIAMTNRYIGHVNEGSNKVELSVHAPSRLMAARGTDGKIRIWHLDDSFPLNSEWHRPRAPQQGELILLPRHQDEPDSSSSSPGAQDDGDDDTWDRLATEDVDGPQFAQVKKARLADVRVQPFCGMAWTPTSWMADRDVQWEMTRKFDEKGRPKLVSAGLLPGLACCSDRVRGTTFLYFESERRAEVEGSEAVQKGASEEAEMEEEGPSAVNDGVEVQVEGQGGN